MKIVIELDATELVRWRGKSGHMEDGQFVVDDPPGEATGPYGKVHGATGNGKTICGKDIPAHMETAPDQASLCAQCVARSEATYLLL